jgi:hypothetical protein
MSGETNKGYHLEQMSEEERGEANKVYTCWRRGQMNMSSKRPSFILFLNLFLTKFINENALSTLAIATGKINTNLRSKYTKS